MGRGPSRSICALMASMGECTLNRRIRILSLWGLGCILAFGSVGDTQTPNGGLPPWSLETPNDVDVLQVAITSTLSRWTDALDAQLVLRDLTFRPVLTTSTTRVYIGSVRSEPRSLVTPRSIFGPPPVFGQPPAPAASFSVQASAQPGLHELGYVHVLGSGCQIPPDQVFASFGRQSAAAATPQNLISNRAQLENLIFVLEGLAGHSTDPALQSLNAWFGVQVDTRLENFRLSQHGDNFSVELFFRSTNSSYSSALVMAVHSHRLPSGDFDQVVVK